VYSQRQLTPVSYVSPRSEQHCFFTSERPSPLRTLSASSVPGSLQPTISTGKSPTLLYAHGEILPRSLRPVRLRRPIPIRPAASSVLTPHNSTACFHSSNELSSTLQARSRTSTRRLLLLLLLHQSLERREVVVLVAVDRERINSEQHLRQRLPNKTRRLPGQEATKRRRYSRIEKLDCV
jgi:hypothetical protein